MLSLQPDISKMLIIWVYACIYIYMGPGRNVFFQKWLKVVFTWGPATYSLLLAQTAGQ